jgi:hypothetical protein
MRVESLRDGRVRFLSANVSEVKNEIRDSITICSRIVAHLIRLGLEARSFRVFEISTELLSGNATSIAQTSLLLDSGRRTTTAHARPKYSVLRIQLQYPQAGRLPRQYFSCSSSTVVPVPSHCSVNNALRSGPAVQRCRRQHFLYKNRSTQVLVGLGACSGWHGSLKLAMAGRVGAHAVAGCQWHHGTPLPRFSRFSFLFCIRNPTQNGNTDTAVLYDRRGGQRCIRCQCGDHGPCASVRQNNVTLG